MKDQPPKETTWENCQKTQKLSVVHFKQTTARRLRGRQIKSPWMSDSGGPKIRIKHAIKQQIFKKIERCYVMQFYLQ